MPIPARSTLALAVCLSLGCGQTPANEPLAASAGAPSAAAGSAQGNAGAAAFGAGGRTLSEAAGAAGGSSAGAAAATAEAGSAGVGVAAPEGFAAGAEGDSAASDIPALLSTYRSFAPRTPAPVNVSAYIFGLCRLPTLRETEFQASIHGDGRYLQDWANALAGQGIEKQGEPAFPVGAVIVKEKYAGSQAAQAELVAIALMIKRAAGFDPAHGDWDYAYYEPALGVVQNAEQTAYCANCHAGAAATDFVYVDGLSP